MHRLIQKAFHKWKAIVILAAGQWPPQQPPLLPLYRNLLQQVLGLDKRGLVRKRHDQRLVRVTSQIKEYSVVGRNLPEGVGQLSVNPSRASLGRARGTHFRRQVAHVA